MTDRIFPCGCHNTWDTTWGMWKCLAKCPHHVEIESRNHGLQYYRSLGCFDEAGYPGRWYGAQFAEALGAMSAPLLVGPGRAVEVGGGPGVYQSWLRGKYYYAVLVEPDAEACEYARQAGGEVFGGSWREYLASGPPPADLIIAAHVCEHMLEGPAVFASFFENLKPGGRLLTIVPDDEDPLNPGHWWFYNPAALEGALARAGFEDVRTWVARRIPREQFIYSYARRPE